MRVSRNAPIAARCAEYDQISQLPQEPTLSVSKATWSLAITTRWTKELGKLTVLAGIFIRGPAVSRRRQELQHLPLSEGWLAGALPFLWPRHEGLGQILRHQRYYDRSLSRGRFWIPAEDLRSLYGGDLLTRPKLIGDWGDLRTKLAKRGITIDVDVLQTYQGVVDGERNEDDAYGGSADCVVNADFGKLGLWPGGFLELFGKDSSATASTATPARFWPRAPTSCFRRVAFDSRTRYRIWPVEGAIEEISVK